MPALQPLFHAWFPALDRPIYTRASFLTLTLWHIGLVLAATVPVVIAGIAAGVFVTRRSGREFAGILDTVTAIGQTFPPAAVLAIAVPLVGYGAAADHRRAHRLWHPAGGRQHHRRPPRRVAGGAAAPPKAWASRPARSSSGWNCPSPRR